MDNYVSIFFRENSKCSYDAQLYCQVSHVKLYIRVCFRMISLNIIFQTVYIDDDIGTIHSVTMKEDVTASHFAPDM